MPRRERDDPSHHVLAIGDLHCGSTRAICHPGFKTLEGVTVGLSPIQQWIWKCWRVFIEEEFSQLPRGYTLLLMGDIIEGNHHRTTQLISPDVADHFNLAVNLLRDIADKAGKVYVVTGTECHTHSSEHGLGAMFDAEPCPHTGSLAWDELDVSINGTLTRCVHHMNTSSRLGLYGTGLSVQLAESEAQAVRVGRQPPRVVIAGHRHTCGHYGDGRSLSLSVAPWQIKTRHAVKVVPNSRSHVGAIRLHYRKHGEVPDFRIFRCDPEW